jgi:HD superfamily phosphodiesterase
MRKADYPVVIEIKASAHFRIAAASPEAAQKKAAALLDLVGRKVESAMTNTRGYDEQAGMGMTRKLTSRSEHV